MPIDHTENYVPEPTVICIKVVPDDDPNAEGMWKKVVAEARHTNPQKYDTERKRLTVWDALIELAPLGHHVVAVQSDLRFDGKPGNWWPTPNNQEG